MKLQYGAIFSIMPDVSQERRISGRLNFIYRAFDWHEAEVFVK